MKLNCDLISVRDDTEPTKTFSMGEGDVIEIKGGNTAQTRWLGTIVETR